MYQVFLDGEFLHNPLEEDRILIDPVVKLALDDAGQFSFTIAPEHPLYDRIWDRVSMVRVLKDGEEIFCGEVREQEKAFHQEKQVYCVGELAFLNDSIQPQGEFHDIEPRVFLDTLLKEHNAQVEEKKRFQTGIVTVHDTNDSLYRYTNYETTLEDLRDKICDRLSGHLRVRKENGIRYLDVVRLSDYGKICQQTIAFGENLLDYAEKTSGTELYTACVPLGAAIEEEVGVPGEEPGAEGSGALDQRVDITSVNGGVNYLYLPEAVERYGWIKTVVKFDDVHLPENLMKKGEEWLRDNQFENITLSLQALDLSLVSPETFDSFAIGDSVHVLAEPYGMDRYFPVESLEIYLTQPEKNVVNLGTNVKSSVSDLIVSGEKNVDAQIGKTYERTQWLQSAIDNATQMLTGKKGGYRLDEYDENGLFLRTLYMDAPNKEDAVNILQIGPQGIGFSNNGYDGPYENAWTIDGVLVGKFIKAHSVKAEALETEYIEHVEKQIEDAETGAKEWADERITTSIKAVNSQITLAVDTERKRASGVEESLSSRITVAQNSISSEVSRATNEESYLRSRITQTENSITSEVIRAKNAENNLSSLIRQTANEITLCIKDEDLTGNKIISKINMSSTTATISASKVNIDAEDIRMQATRLSWKSKYSSMSSDGKLSCQDAVLYGNFQTKQAYGSSYKLTKLESGVIKGYFGSSQYGLLDMSAIYVDNRRHVALKGYDYLHLQAGTKIYLERATEVLGELSAAKLTSGDGVTGTISFVGIQGMYSDGRAASWNTSKTNLRFRNGILVST